MPAPFHTAFAIDKHLAGRQTLRKVQTVNKGKYLKFLEGT
jgi:hypothetical protein